ncbi:MAG: COX15/CtaA family protein [Agriterribacter sp.]
MNNSFPNKSDRAVGLWMLAGVIMIMVQVLLGGITRLTESGLSITDWKPLTKILPPIGLDAWQAEFEKYKHTDQFKYIHSDFTLSDFKFIFFWEWFHRLWAKMLAVVFLVGFIYFIWKKKFKKNMILPLIILFFLGAIQGAIGWIMVKSGLVPEKYFVDHVKLTTHFIAALGLLVYTLWFALSLLVPQEQTGRNTLIKRFLITLIIVLFVQLTYGGFMAGLRAATAAPTWPTINGEWAPASMYKITGGANYFNNPFMVQFIHRGIAYIFTILMLIWFFTAIRAKISPWFSKTRIIPLLLVCAQVTLGILTVIYSVSTNAFVLLGVAHQFVAMLLLTSLVWMLYLVKE